MGTTSSITVLSMTSSTRPRAIKKPTQNSRTAQGRGRPSEESTPSVNTESLAPNLRTSSDRVASLHVSLPALDKVVVQMATFWRGQSLLSIRGSSKVRSNHYLTGTTCCTTWGKKLKICKNHKLM